MFEQQGAFTYTDTISFQEYKLTWGLVHRNIVQDIEVFCKGLVSLIKMIGAVDLWPFLVLAIIDWIFIMWKSWMWLVIVFSLAGSLETSSSHRGHEWQPSLTQSCFTNISHTGRYKVVESNGYMLPDKVVGVKRIHVAVWPCHRLHVAGWPQSG